MDLSPADHRQLVEKLRKLCITATFNGRKATISEGVLLQLLETVELYEAMPGAWRAGSGL